jgi:transposase InsO family protein
MNKYSTSYFLLQMRNLDDIIAGRKGVTQTSLEMRVSRQTVHKWLARYKRFGGEGVIPAKRKNGSGGHNRVSAELEDLVIRLAEDHCTDGVQMLADRLEAEYQTVLHPATLYRILKRRNIRYDRFWVHTQRQRKKQLYAHREAGFELQMDTKYPFGYKIGVVVYTVIDDASRWGFARVYETANAKNTVDFLRRLKSRAPFNIQKIRTDCGTEFVARVVQRFLRRQGVLHRKNTPYCPEENGKIERFHRTLNEKAISLYWSPRDPLETLQYRLSQFLAWYNGQKRHRGLGMRGLTPLQKLNELAGQSVNLTLQCNIY